MGDFASPILVLSAKVFNELIAQFKKTKIHFFFNHESKNVQKLFFIEKLSLFENVSDLIFLELKIVRRVCADRLIFGFLKALIFILLQVRNNAAPEIKLFFLDFRHGFHFDSKV